MSDAEFILTADRFDQIVERRPDRSPLRTIKHRRGDIVTGLTDAEVERLSIAGAIMPYVPSVLDDLDEDAVDDDPDGDPDADSPDRAEPDGRPDDQGPDDQEDDQAAGELDPAAVTEADEATEAADRPMRTAGVADWRDYAVRAHGLSRAEAAALTRAELIARFGR
ncbi:hypothetical protein ACWESM_18565 [Nocardia sp. NPDC003999]